MQHVIKSQFLLYSPFLIIIGYTFFFVPWNTHPTIIAYQQERALKALQDSVHIHMLHDSITGRYGGGFALPNKRTYLPNQDTLFVSISQSKFTPIHSTASTHQFRWDVGFLEGWQDEKWIPMYSNFQEGEMYSIPVTYTHGESWTADSTFLHLLLPARFRANKAGEKTTLVTYK